MEERFHKIQRHELTGRDAILFDIDTLEINLKEENPNTGVNEIYNLYSLYLTVASGTSQKSTKSYVFSGENKTRANDRIKELVKAYPWIEALDAQKSPLRVERKRVFTNSLQLRSTSYPKVKRS